MTADDHDSKGALSEWCRVLDAVQNLIEQRGSEGRVPWMLIVLVGVALDRAKGMTIKLECSEPGLGLERYRLDLLVAPSELADLLRADKICALEVGDLITMTDEIDSYCSRIDSSTEMGSTVRLSRLVW
jgi:hypothetical protein